jgi:hypothetical protein
MTEHRSLFADGMMEASVTHGVVRITLAQAGSDGKPHPAGQLVMPLVQLPAFANGLLNLLRQVESRIKESQAQQNPAAAAAPATAALDSAAATNGEAAAPPVVGAFRFNS